MVVTLACPLCCELHSKPCPIRVAVLFWAGPVVKPFFKMGPHTRNIIFVGGREFSLEVVEPLIRVVWRGQMLQYGWGRELGEQFTLGSQVEAQIVVGAAS